MSSQQRSDGEVLERLDRYLDAMRALAWTHTVCPRCDGIGDEPGEWGACNGCNGAGIIAPEAIED